MKLFTVSEDRDELLAYLTANPKVRDELLADMGLPTMGTIRAGLRLADTISRPAWADEVRSSMTLSSHVETYVRHRDA